MTIDQLLRELRTVAPVDFNEWRQLRSLEINNLTPPEKERLDAAVDRLFESALDAL